MPRDRDQGKNPRKTEGQTKDQRGQQQQQHAQDEKRGGGGEHRKQ